MRYLAIDYGNKRTGLAVSDESELIITPLKVLQTDGALVSHILKIIAIEQIEQIILGLPLNMDGTEGRQAAVVRKFGSQLSVKTNVKVVYHDERLSSFDAKELLAPAEMSWRKRKKILDAVAAAAILRSYIDMKSPN